MFPFHMVLMIVKESDIYIKYYVVPAAQLFALNWSCNMYKFVRYSIFGMFFIQLAVFAAFSAETVANEKPKADKLTISIDSVSQRIPPQIAYFIPDGMFNRSFDFNFNRNLPQPPIINMWPPSNPRNFNQTFNNFNVTDLMMSQQHPYRFTAIPKNEVRAFVEEDPETAYQNFNYQIDFAKIPDKEPDFKRFESLNREREIVKQVKPKKKHIKRPVFTNYANTSPNIRSKIKYIKIDHENKFEVSKDKPHSSDSGIYSDELEHNTSDRLKLYNNGAKLKKARRKINKKPQHYSMIKLSRPTSFDSSAENESGYNYDIVNTDETDQYHSEHPTHNKCEHPNSDLTELPENENDSGTNVNFDENTENKVNNKRPKGFAIYLTKVIKHPKPYRSLRMDKNKISHNDFVPTRIMSSVRGYRKILHKPRKTHKPTMRARLRESGAHIVYTEDGYEDKEYDHDVEDKSLEYRSRTRRSTNPKNLKGQELLDHLDKLIANVSEYLNSSEIIPETNKKFPLYNKTDDSIKNSPIKYSEHAKPVVDENYSSELYESKTEDCEDMDEEIDLSNAHNSTNSPKKRLGNLGNKLNCLKSKFFGKNPLNNPLFHEDVVSQPKPHNMFTNIMQEAENIQTISEIVHSDVMDNIKFNSFNENQRIFSDYGVSDNFAAGIFNSNPVTVKIPANKLNMNENYLNTQKEKNKHRQSPSVVKNPLSMFSPFNDPARLPILDISKYLPTPSYSTTESDDDVPLQTDFVPIVSPYVSNYNKRPTMTLTSSTTAKTTTTTTTTTDAPFTQNYHTIYGSANKNLRGPLRRIPYYNNQYPNHRHPMKNILLYKNRRPVAVVHIVPKKLSAAV